MATEVKVRASRRTNNQGRSPAHSRTVMSLKPKLGDFGLIKLKLFNPVADDIETASKDTGRRGKPTRPRPGTPPTKTLDAPQLAKDFLLKLLETPQASSCCCRTTTGGDSSVSTIQDDTTGPSDDSSGSRAVSPITTTTSPDIDGSTLVKSRPLPLDPRSYSNPGRTQQLPGLIRPTEQVQQYRTSASHNNAAAQIIPEDPSSSIYHELMRKHRVKLAYLVSGKRTSSAAAALTLPWDAEGNYVDGIPPHTVSPKHNWRRNIEPLYRVSKQLQLQILGAWLDDAICDDNNLRAKFLVSHQPIHVFVDMSNIVIGFCKQAPRNFDYTFLETLY